MRHAHVRSAPATRVFGALLTCLLAVTLVVAAQRPHGHPHTIRAGAVAAVNSADTGHAPPRIDHAAVPSRAPSAQSSSAQTSAPAKPAPALYERTADSRRVRGPPLEALG